MTSTSPLTLVLVDSTVNDYESLVQNLRAEVVVLNPTQDGVEQITEVLAAHDNIESLHILSHGDAGRLYLGSTQLSSETLDHYSDQIQDWQQAFTSDTNILLYGCEVAGDEEGRQFVRQLSELTQSDIAASTNLTGSAALGGDWELEFVTGEIHAPLVFDAAAIAAYESVLGVLVSESFTNDDVTEKTWKFETGSVSGVQSAPPFLTARTDPTTPAGGLPGGGTDAAGQGALRLTSAAFNQSAFVLYDKPFSAAQGVSISFDFFAYGGSSRNSLPPGGDGISFFLVDAAETRPITAGGFGGSLGYANSVNPTVGGVPGTTISGIEGGYVGVGFDEFGNFSSNTEGRNGGAAGGLTADSVAVRGRESSGYTYLTGTGTLNPGIDNLSATSRAAAQRRAQIDITPVVGSTGGILSVKVDLDNDGNFTDAGETLPDYDLRANNGAFPANLKLGFASSTGDSTNIHEVRNLKVTTFSPGVTFSGTGVTTDPATGISSLTTIEGGTAQTVSVVLGKRPTSNVTLNLVSTDTTEGTVSVPALTFTPANWDTPQTFTITPVDDAIADGSIPYTITTTFTSTDPEYAALNPADISVTNFDNEPAAGNTPPVVPTVTPPAIAPGGTVALTGLTATDPDGIGFYTITTIPAPDQGTLFLGNPAANGVPVTAGQNLTPAQIGQLFFRAGAGFSSTDFTYTATDSRGATSARRTVPFGEICLPGTPINGTNGRNRLDGANGVNDIIFGRGGNDRIRGLSCNDVLDGGAGNDRIIGGTGRDTIRGRTGNDTILGGAGADNLNGGLGADRVDGGDGDDNIRGRRGVDLLIGRAGNDIISGGLRNDRIRGGAGDDILDGGRGDDVVKGGGGNDRITGRAGRDTLVGFAGNDTMAGGLGNDLLVGGLGADRLSGNRGRDVFEYRSLQEGGDTITDFAANRDSINLSRISGGRSFGSFVRLSQSGSDTLVQVRGGSGSTLLATLTGVTASTLTASNFVL
jgi:Ca2+-binding RTX toxin-like protein